MKKLGVVFAHEFRETVRSKPYRTISVFLVIVLVILFCAVAFMVFDSAQTDAPISVDGYAYDIALIDRSDGISAALREDLPYINFVDIGEEDDFELLLTSGAYDAVVVLTGARSFECYQTAALYSDSGVSDTIAMSLGELAGIAELEALGVSAQDAQEIVRAQVDVANIAVGNFDIGKYVYNYMMIILMFLGLGLYGQLVASRVASEKTGRTMEVLVTSASPNDLLSGKVLGVGAASLLQLSVFFALCLVGMSAAVASVPSMSQAIEMIRPSAADIALLLCYFVLGFVLMAYVYGAIGSLVSQPEDLSGISSIPMYIFMVGYFISIFSMSSGGSGTLLRICSHVPFWSPVTMFSRMAVEAVPTWEILLSLALLAATAVFMAFLSARIYRMGTLMYGKPPKLRELVRMLKADKTIK